MWFHSAFIPSLMAWWIMATSLITASSGAALRKRTAPAVESPGEDLQVLVLIPSAYAQSASTLADEVYTQKDGTSMVLRNTTSVSPAAGEFPICTDINGPLAPFCFPEDGAEVIVGATYYVTWNADFYPLNATITIEMRYSNSSQGDSAFTSERTDNSYGYIPLHMQKEWLQGKPHNALTLYIIELDATSGSRASARQGPTVILYPKPVEHYKPPPQIPFNKKALYIGLPVSLGVVIVVVAGLFFGMRRSRRIGLRDIMSAHCKGYGIGKSKNQRIGNKNILHRPDSLSAMNKYTEDFDEGCSEFTGPEKYDGLERSGSFACRQEVARLKTWSR